MCCEAVCYKGSIVVIDVSCIDFVYVYFEKGQFICSELGKGVTSDPGKCLFRATNV